MASTMRGSVPTPLPPNHLRAFSTPIPYQDLTLPFGLR